ncbi:endonuclease [Rubrivirga sp.]|uniref:endonuclease n=1 Tax=Rubrivirga sp. TaxID=1885344 RepID=UPI003B52D664
MRVLSAALLGLLVSASALGQTVLFPGVQGPALLDSIRASYAPAQTLGYGPARDQLYTYNQQADGALCGVYTGFCVQLSPNADPSQHAFAKGINAEHTWPQSFGADTNQPQGSDMHNLFPSREDVNAARGNDPFGEIPDAQTQRWYRGSAQQSAIPTTDLDEWSEDRPDRFEPRHDHKGNAARAVFYFYAIYPGPITSTGDAFFAQMLDDLLTWNETDAVDDREAARSEWIASKQGTPNPFVVDPSLARRAYAPSSVAAEDGPAGLGLAVFPNPTAGRVVVEGAGLRGAEVEVLDVVGRRVAWARAAADRYTVDLSAAPPGVYVVRVTVGGAVAVRRVVVAR